VAGDPESLDDSRAARIEHVDELVVDGDARREAAAGVDVVLESKLVAVHAERRDRIASRVHREQQPVAGVVDERSL
jgi:hypothetical protein